MLTKLLRSSLLWAATFFILCSVLVFNVVNHLFLQKDDNLQFALEQGKELVINVETGDIIEGFTVELMQGHNAPEEEAASEKDAAKSHGDDKKEVEKPQEATATKDKPQTTSKKEQAPEATTPKDEKQEHASVTPEQPTAAEEPQPEKPIATSGAKELPKISIIIEGLGLSRTTTEKAIVLPADVTLSFSPYAPHLEKWFEIAQQRNHELCLNLPLEPTRYPMDDPGPYALLTELEEEKNIERLKWVLSRAEKGYVGVVSGSDEKFTSSMRSIKPVFRYLRDKDISFVYGGQVSNSSLFQIANRIGVDLISRDIIVDQEITREKIKARLDEVEKRAKQNGYALALARPYPLTVDMLRTWIVTLEKKGIDVVPLTKLFD